MIRDFAGGPSETAVCARAAPNRSGCDGWAPEGTSGAPAKRGSDPANACQTRASVSKIDLACVLSEMDLRAERTAQAAIAKAQEAMKADGKVWCGPCDARVPGWFGVECIAADCPLRKVAA